MDARLDYLYKINHSLTLYQRKILKAKGSEEPLVRSILNLKSL